MRPSRSKWDYHLPFYGLGIYVRLYWSWELVFFLSRVRRGYIHKFSVHLVQKYFPHDYSTDSNSCSKQNKKKSDENNIKTIQRLDIDETVLLLTTWNQGKPTLRCCCQSTRPVVSTLLPLSLSSIPWKRCLYSSNTSVVVIVVVFVIIFLLWHLHWHCILLGIVVYPSPPPSLSLIPHAHRVFLVLCWRLLHRH